MSKTDIENMVETEAEEGRRVFRLMKDLPLPCNDSYRLSHPDLDQAIASIRQFDPQNLEFRRWYANGPTCEDRPNVLASYHPVIHKRDDAWKQIVETAIALAKDLNRWIWLTLGEDRWVRILAGHMPHDPAWAERTSGPLFNAAGEYQNDQYITCFAPDGREFFVGCS